MRLSSSENSTYVFDSMNDGLIKYSRLINGQHEEPKPFEGDLNAGEANAHPFISPDESYILWDSRRSTGYGNADIYISFKNPDSTWSKAINLGDQINTASSEFGATVTPDGKYLFFNRNVGKLKPTDPYEDTDIFWVSTQVIEGLRPTN